MVRLTDLRGNYYYMTEAIIPPAFQQGDELNDVIKFVRVVKDGWIICFSDRFLRDKVAIRADQIYLAVEVEAPQC